MVVCIETLFCRVEANEVLDMVQSRKYDQINATCPNRWGSAYKNSLNCSGLFRDKCVTADERISKDECGHGRCCSITIGEYSFVFLFQVINYVAISTVIKSDWLSFMACQCSNRFYRDKDFIKQGSKILQWNSTKSTVIICWASMITGVESYLLVPFYSWLFYNLRSGFTSLE